jgi:preprotein translocase subunit SecE
MAIDKDDAVDIVASDAVTPTTPVAAAAAPKGPGPIKRFIREVITELKKTHWPSKDELTKSVAVVVITIIAVAVFLWLSDITAAKIMQYVGISVPNAGR